MNSSYGPSATVETPMEPGWGVYDREGHPVGLVEDVLPDEDAFSIRQAGLGLGVLGGEFVVPQRLVADSRGDAVTLNLRAAELEVYSARR